MAITKATFIDEAYLQKYTPISANVDVKLVAPFIITGQDKFAQFVLGTEFYERLMTGISANDLTAKETELIQLCQPAIAWLTLVESIPFINVGIRNKGIVKGTSETTQPAERSEVNNLIEACRNNYEHYMTQVQSWLCIDANSSGFTLYNSPTRDMYPNKSKDVYTCDIYTGGDVGERSIQNWFRSM